MPFGELYFHSYDYEITAAYNARIDKAATIAKDARAYAALEHACVIAKAVQAYNEALARIDASYNFACDTACTIKSAGLA